MLGDIDFIPLTPPTSCFDTNNNNDNKKNASAFPSVYEEQDAFLFSSPPACSPSINDDCCDEFINIMNTNNQNNNGYYYSSSAYPSSSSSYPQQQQPSQQQQQQQHQRSNSFTLFNYQQQQQQQQQADMHSSSGFTSVPLTPMTPMTPIPTPPITILHDMSMPSTPTPVSASTAHSSDFFALPATSANPTSSFLMMMNMMTMPAEIQQTPAFYQQPQPVYQLASLSYDQQQQQPQQQQQYQQPSSSQDFWSSQPQHQSSSNGYSMCGPSCNIPHPTTSTNTTTAHSSPFPAMITTTNFDISAIYASAQPHLSSVQSSPATTIVGQPSPLPQSPATSIAAALNTLVIPNPNPSSTTTSATSSASPIPSSDDEQGYHHSPSSLSINTLADDAASSVPKEHRCIWLNHGAETDNDVCGIVFGTSAELYDHLVQVHGGKGMVNTPLPVSNEDVKEKPKNRHAGGRLPVTFSVTCRWKGCKQDTKVFVKRNHFMSHCRSHCDLWSNVCLGCKKAFKWSHDLKKHGDKTGHVTGSSSRTILRKSSSSSSSSAHARNRSLSSPASSLLRPSPYPYPSAPASLNVSPRSTVSPVPGVISGLEGLEVRRSVSFGGFVESQQGQQLQQGQPRVGGMVGFLEGLGIGANAAAAQQQQ
ncbi:hypothetical protein HDU97_005905 [Phlyctochytrium planicorne]|nr:hypothetical protein HDU97_005905 [Phlyctochytrium planicorne]